MDVASHSRGPISLGWFPPSAVPGDARYGPSDVFSYNRCAMLTSGIDLASQDARTAACVVDWSGEMACVTELTLGVNDARIIDLILTTDKVGIDSPLGWPIAFAEAVAGHSFEGSWPGSYLHSDNTSFRYRRTDLNVWTTVGSAPPLSVSTDKIAFPAMRAAAVLSRLPERMALDGSGPVVEVYPAAALRRWGLASRKYKGRANLAARGELVDAFVARSNNWLRLDDVAGQLCRSSDDAFDSLIAALVARACVLSLIDAIPEEDRPSARREGWIALPTPGSLEGLMPW